MSHRAIRPNVLFYLVLAPTLWGGNFVVGSVIAHDLSGPWTNFLRWLIALGVVTPFCWKEAWRYRSSLLRHWRGLALMGFLGVTLFNTVLYIALQNASVSIAAVAFAVSPFITTGMEALLRRDLPSSRLAAGAFIALTGMLLAQGEALQNGTSLIGIALVLLAAVIWSAYCVSLKHCAPDVPARASFSIQITIGLVMMGPILMFFEAPTALVIGAKELLGLLYLGIFAASLAFWIWQMAISDVGPARASVFMNLVPISSVVLSAMFMGLPISMFQALSFLLVFFGVCLTSHSNVFQSRHFTRKRTASTRAFG